MTGRRTERCDPRDARVMKRIPALLVMELSAVMLAWAAGASGEVSLDWKVRHLYPTSSSLYEGPITVRCEWRASIAISGRFSKPIRWFGLISLDGVPENFERSYAPNDVVYSTMTATNEFNGSAEATFTVSKGAHKIGCIIAVTGSDTHEAASRTANNKRELAIDVKPLHQVTPATFPTARPKLTLTVKGTSDNPSCQDPANLAAVSLSVHSNLPLASSKGTVRVTDATPTAPGILQSNDVVLPAIGGNASVAITVILGATVPPATLVGVHALVVGLHPYMEAGQPTFDPPSPVSAVVGFPAGWCP
jgi:hypothetical protein